MNLFGFQTNKASMNLIDFLQDSRFSNFLDFEYTKTDNKNISQLFI